MNPEIDSRHFQRVYSNYMICPPSFGTVPRNWYWGHGLWVDLPLDLHRHRGGSGHWSLASFPQLASFGQRPNCRWGGSIPGASAGFQVSVDSFTESQRVGGSSSWGHLCHCHCYVVYHNLSYFQICSSLYCLPGRIAHLWSSMCIAWFCHRHDRTWEIAKQKKTWFVLMCGVVWCQGLCESALAADGWERFDFPGSATRSGWSREWRDEVRRSRTRTSKSWQHRSWVGFVSTPLHLPPCLR